MAGHKQCRPHHPHNRYPSPGGRTKHTPFIFITLSTDNAQSYLHSINSKCIVALYLFITNFIINMITRHSKFKFSTMYSFALVLFLRPKLLLRVSQMCLVYWLVTTFMDFRDGKYTLDWLNRRWSNWTSPLPPALASGMFNAIFSLMSLSLSLCIRDLLSGAALAKFLSLCLSFCLSLLISSLSATSSSGYWKGQLRIEEWCM